MGSLCLTFSLSTRMKSLILMILYMVVSIQAGPTPGLEDGEAESRAVIACFTSWGRCTRWSSWATGWLWQTCDDKCKKRGISSGCLLKDKSLTFAILVIFNLDCVVQNFPLKFVMILCSKCSLLHLLLSI